MGELFRSREVELIQLYIQLDAVRDTLEELGNRSLVQFRDVSFCHPHSFLSIAIAHRYRMGSCYHA